MAALGRPVMVLIRRAVPARLMAGLSVTAATMLMASVFLPMALM